MTRATGLGESSRPAGDGDPALDGCDQLTSRPRPSPAGLTRREALQSLSAAWLSKAWIQRSQGRYLRGSWLALLVSELTPPPLKTAIAMAPPQTPPPRGTTTDSTRLPRHVHPTRYDLAIAPDLDRGTFDGEATITLSVARATRELLFHAVDLQIAEASVQQDEHPPQPAHIAMLPDLERCRLSFTAPLEPGTCTLRVHFRGQLNDQLHGFYRSSFVDEQGTRQTLAVTQFEAADARRAFPCWDEPDFKAVFSLRLTVQASLTALSNTRILSQQHQDGMIQYQFADTIAMSTYLLAFVVGRLEGTDPTFVGQTPIRLWTTPGKRHLAEYGQTLAAFALHFFEDYYGLPYPGDKLDLIAIPDFSHGAMENLGAITFRESALLIDPTQATHGELSGLADVICHEIAHMWFGDLVTMAWWNGLWLNEAFATFLEVVAVDAWQPAWQRWDEFALARSSALSTDGLHASRPVEFPVHSVNDLGAMFDVLTYQKGAAVLRMLEQYLGAEVFRHGVRQYLQAHAYGNTETDDLWNHLGAVGQQPIADIMHRWVFEPGYPLLTLSLNRRGQLVVRQQRFTYSPRPSGPSRQGAPRARRWHVPLHLAITTSSGTHLERRLLSTGETTWTLPDDWHRVQLNPGGHGYYRVRYAPALLAKLLAQLPDGLPPIDRFNILNDAWALCRAGLMTVHEYLEVTNHFVLDDSSQVWSLLLHGYERLDAARLPQDRTMFATFIREQLGPKFQQLRWTPEPGEDALVRELRADVIRAMGTLGEDPATQEQARERYRTLGTNQDSEDPNLTPALMDIVSYTGSEREYEEFLARYATARTPQEERRYLFGLTGFREPALVTRTLEMTLSDRIRTQDGATVIGALVSRRHGRDLAWAFLTQHWETLSSRFPANGLRRLFSHLPSQADRAFEREVRHFVSAREIHLGGKALEQILEQLQIAATFRAGTSQALHEYLLSR